MKQTLRLNEPTGEPATPPPASADGVTEPSRETVRPGGTRARRGKGKVRRLRSEAPPPLSGGDLDFEHPDRDRWPRRD